MVNFKGFDPLVANGILPASVHDIITYNIPLPSQIRYQIATRQNGDRFVTNPQAKKDGFSWKKFILGSMVAAGALLGIKKYGLKGFLSKFKPSSVKNYISQGFGYVKNQISKIFTKTP